MVIKFVGNNVEKLKPSYIVGRIVKWFSCCGKTFVSCSKK
jgi:hypothetical protein